MNELLGSRIKAFRSANKFTQEQVADQIGISRQKYARIESGVNSITVVNGRFCPQSVRSFCPIVAGFNAGTYKVPACVL